MCFSASASFIASGGLAVVGVASLVKAKGIDKIIAVIPFLFAIQQAFEFFQWLSLGTGTVSHWAAYGFLFFAFVVWPLYVPIALYFQDEKKRRSILFFILLGAIVALYFIFQIPTQPVYIETLTTRISYNFYFPFGGWVNILYMTAVFGPLLISSHNVFRWFGVIISFLAIVAWVFFTISFISVWCFFAAVVSSIFFVYLVYKKKPENNIQLNN